MASKIIAQTALGTPPLSAPKLEPEILRAKRRKAPAAPKDCPQPARLHICSAEKIEIEEVHVYKVGDGYCSITGNPRVMIDSGFVHASWFGGRRSASGRWLGSKKFVLQDMCIDTSINAEGDHARVCARPVNWCSPLAKAIEKERTEVASMFQSASAFRKSANNQAQIYCDVILAFVDRTHDGYTYSDETERKVRKALCNVQHYLRRGEIFSSASARAARLTEIRAKTAKANEPLQKMLAKLTGAVESGDVLKGVRQGEAG